MSDLLPEIIPEVPVVSDNFYYIIGILIFAISSVAVAVITARGKSRSEGGDRSSSPRPRNGDGQHMHPIHAEMLTNIHRETIEIHESQKSLHRRFGVVEERLTGIEGRLPRRRE